ncbi:MAG TPA: hypothetical protein PKC49_04160 [Phycisphaerae bacterium]|nr:hypothetical protein [Phycisphaerae bacterium]
MDPFALSLLAAGDAATPPVALAIVIRILHIAAATTAVGAVVFKAVALQPSLRVLDDGQRAALRAAVIPRWRAVVFAAIAVLLVTGLLTFVLYRIPEYRGTPHAGLYHGLFGLKLLLALAVFHPATMLVLSGPAGDRRPARAPVWLRLTLAGFGAIIILGAVLRYLPPLTA